MLEPAEVLLLVGRVARRVHRRLRLGRASETTRGLEVRGPGLKHDRGEGERDEGAGETWILVKKPIIEIQSGYEANQ